MPDHPNQTEIDRVQDRIDKCSVRIAALEAEDPVGNADEIAVLQTDIANDEAVKAALNSET